MSMMSTIEQRSSFEQQAASVLARLARALDDLIAGIPAELATAADLERAIRIDKRLSWRIFKVARSAEPLSVGYLVPGRASLAKFIKAATRHGAPSALVEPVHEVFDEFERVVKTHAVDRSAFDSMVSAFAAEGASQIDLQQRRAAFRAQSHILGIQARTRMSCYIMHPAADGELGDVVCIRGVVQLQQTRHHTSWTISRSYFSDNDLTRIVPPDGREPLDQQAEASHGVALMREFCSNPLPNIRSETTEAGLILTELLLKGLGRTAAVTCVLGDASRNVAELCRDEHNRHIEAQVAVRTPVESLISDLLVFEGMYGPIRPRVLVYSDHDDTSESTVGRERDLLPFNASVKYLGQGPSVLATPQVPRYPEMAQYAFDRMGWDGERFDVYRCRIEYPLMPSTVAVQFDLPEQPQE